MMRFAILLSLVSFIVPSAMAAVLSVSLWPEGRIPGFNAGQTMPLLEVSLPEGRTNDTLLIIAPGGSYMKWCEWEGRCAAYFNKRGMATALLKYRTPPSTGRSEAHFGLAGCTASSAYLPQVRQGLESESREDILHGIFRRRQSYAFGCDI